MKGEEITAVTSARVVGIFYGIDSLLVDASVLQDGTKEYRKVPLRRSQGMKLGYLM